jgi:hypothetical protein
MNRIPATLAGTLALLCPLLARASGFATPPGQPVPEDSPVLYQEAPQPTGEYAIGPSSVRLSTGPVLRATSDHADGGLAAAIDVGARAAGARLAGTWVRTGSDRGLSQYGGQLWVDFGAEQRLHPILAAGAGLARLQYRDAAGALRASTLGVGTLRGTLEYVLPIREANARVGIDVEGALPAIRGADAPDVNGWVLLTARVGIGF